MHAHTPALTGQRARSRAMTRVDTSKETTSYRVPGFFASYSSISYWIVTGRLFHWGSTWFKYFYFNFWISIFFCTFFFVCWIFTLLSHVDILLSIALFHAELWCISRFLAFLALSIFWPSRNCEILHSNYDNNHFCELQPYFINFFPMDEINLLQYPPPLIAFQGDFFQLI